MSNTNAIKAIVILRLIKHFKKKKKKMHTKMQERDHEGGKKNNAQTNRQFTSIAKKQNNVPNID